MKLQKNIKFAFLLLIALSLTNCGDKACQTELETTKQKLADLEKALDTPSPALMSTTAAFNFCGSSEAISSGNYNTLTGTANIIIPIPEDNSFVSKTYDRATNTISYLFSGETYGTPTKDYPDTLTGLSRVRESELTVEVTFEYTTDNCETPIMTERVKKSKVQGLP
ncbi:hypothetical protein [Olleya sp. R77988]|uniref:hypothetical protein n=1 Tax=Olleya sp. R77988 TaxID=3093875 RepID=UPI0037C7DE29